MAAVGKSYKNKIALRRLNAKKKRQPYFEL
jgi:hypothetical protein